MTKKRKKLHISEEILQKNCISIKMEIISESSDTAKKFLERSNHG